MIELNGQERVWRPRLLPKDIGVGLVVLVCLGLGWLLMAQTTGQTRVYAEPESPFRLSYPAGWIGVDSLQDVLIKVEDPQAPAAWKTTLSVERRDLDPASPPTLQTLLDRRVEERSLLTGYHFLDESEVTVAGARAIRLDYAYVVQPIDEPRRASLPVVVVARDYIIVTSDRSYYLTLAAPEAALAEAEPQFERIIQSVQLP